MKSILSLFFKIPQSIRFIFVGGFNTIFGIALFGLSYYLFQPSIHVNLIFIASSVISISVSCVTLKYFVFIDGTYTFTVFIKTFFNQIILMFVSLIFMNLLMHLFHPIISQCISTILTAIIGYFIHKIISFKLDLTSLRNSINRVDRSTLCLLSKRIKIVSDVKNLKQNSCEKEILFIDQHREYNMIKKWQSEIALGTKFDKQIIHHFFRSLISISNHIEQDINITISKELLLKHPKSLLYYPFARNIKIKASSDIFKDVRDYEIIITELNSTNLINLKENGLQIFAYYKSDDIIYFYIGKIKDNAIMHDDTDYFYIVNKSINHNILIDGDTNKLIVNNSAMQDKDIYYVGCGHNVAKISQ
jgi:chorismate mutase/putative flippase GtrA